MECRCFMVSLCSRPSRTVSVTVKAVVSAHRPWRCGMYHCSALRKWQRHSSSPSHIPAGSGHPALVPKVSLLWIRTETFMLSFMVFHEHSFVLVQFSISLSVWDHGGSQRWSPDWRRMSWPGLQSCTVRPSQLIHKTCQWECAEHYRMLCCKSIAPPSGDGASLQSSTSRDRAGGGHLHMNYVLCNSRGEETLMLSLILWSNLL